MPIIRPVVIFIRLFVQAMCRFGLNKQNIVDYSIIFFHNFRVSTLHLPTRKEKGIRIDRTALSLVRPSLFHAL